MSLPGAEAWLEAGARALWGLLWVAGKLATLSGWLMIATASFPLLKNISGQPQSGPNPWSAAGWRLVGGLLLVQAAPAFELASSWVFASPTAGPQGNLRDWFAFDSTAGGDLARRFADVLFQAGAVLGYAMFAWGLWRVARTGQPDGNGRPVRLGRSLMTLLAGVAVAHTPWLASRIAPAGVQWLGA